MEHLHDIMALQINNFNSFFNGCNNLRGLSGRDNILWMIVASKPNLPYIWTNESQVVVDHLNLELFFFFFLLLLLLYIHVLGYVKGILRGNCSAECVDSSII